MTDSKKPYTERLEKSNKTYATEKEAVEDKENQVISLLSGFAVDLAKGADFFEKTLEYADRITKIFKQNNL